MSLFSPLAPLDLVTPTPLMNNLPDLFVQINDGDNDLVNGLLPAEQSAFDTLNQNIAQVYNNLFIQTCDDDTLTAHESLYWQVTGFWGDNLVPMVLVTRAQRLLRRRFQTPPFTLATLSGLANLKFRQPGSGYATAYMNTAVATNYLLGSWALGYRSQPFVSYPGQFYLMFPAPPTSSADAVQAMWGATLGAVDPSCIYWITMAMKPAHLTFLPQPYVTGACSTAHWSGGTAAYQSVIGLVEGGTSTIHPLSVSALVNGVSTVTYVVPSTTTGCITSVQLQQAGGGSITGLPLQNVYIPIPSGSSVLMTHLITVS